MAKERRSGIKRSDSAIQTTSTKKRKKLGTPIRREDVKPSETSSPSAVHRGFPVVGIGASAGGLEALVALFSSMPIDTGFGFVLVVHLDPTHVSILPELLQKHTEMPVCQVKDRMPVQPNRVYVIPPNKELTILNRELHLTDMIRPRAGSLPIDSFFQSLAQDQRSQAIGIILSGTGTDGTLGVKAIKSGGGIVMVQDQASAKYDGMPNSAIATGLADYVLAPNKIPLQLLKHTERASQESLPMVAYRGGIDPETLLKICAILKAGSKHDFSQYKNNTICRRIERRMSVHQINDVSDYVRYLRNSDHEVGILFKELLIGVTRFFRDKEAFHILRETILPRLLAGKLDDQTVRVWVPGCASGEEAYSVAIIIHECMEEIDRRLHLQVFGTDIDDDAINVARAGLYPSSAMVNVEPERMKRYFTHEESGQFRVGKSIRDSLVFATQNVIKDPPFTRLDLLCCRNLLIYLGTELQRKLLPIFHYSLEPDGILFLGSSETIGPATDLFAPIDKKWKLFGRKSTASGSHARLILPFYSESRGALDSELSEKAQPADGPSEIQLLETVLRQSHSPPCVIVTESGNVSYIHGRTGRFLEPAEGKANLNVIKMARSGLRRELSTAIRDVAIHKRTTFQKGLRIKDSDGDLWIDLTVKPILEHIVPCGLMMVVFEETEAPSSQGQHISEPAGSDRKQKSVNELELELQYTRENLQTTIEELETSNEELKSSNEELQSTNEELQSTNEELETSKEELQSLNEESATVNAELHSRIEELNNTNDDMKNLLDSTEIASIFLDTKLRVRRYTPRATEIVPLTASDSGHPIDHLASALVGIDLAEYGEKVLDDLGVREIEVESRDHRSFIMRVRSYRTLANVIDGVVFTFEDITERKQAQQALTNSEQRYRMLFELATDSVVLIDPARACFADFNRRAHDHLGYTRAEFAKLSISDVEFVNSYAEAEKHIQKILDRGSDTFETKHVTKDGVIRDVLVRSRTIVLGEKNLLLCTWQDATKTDNNGNSPSAGQAS